MLQHPWEEHRRPFEKCFHSSRNGAELVYALAHVLVTQDIPAADFEAVLSTILASGCVSYMFANCQLARQIIGDRSAGTFEEYLMEASHDKGREVDLAALWVMFRASQEAKRTKTWVKWREWEIVIAMTLQVRWERAFQLREGQDWGDGLEMGMSSLGQCTNLPW